MRPLVGTLTLIWTKGYPVELNLSRKVREGGRELTEHGLEITSYGEGLKTTLLVDEFSLQGGLLPCNIFV